MLPVGLFSSVASSSVASWAVCAGSQLASCTIGLFFRCVAGFFCCCELRFFGLVFSKYTRFFGLFFQKIFLSNSIVFFNSAEVVRFVFT